MELRKNLFNFSLSRKFFKLFCRSYVPDSTNVHEEEVKTKKKKKVSSVKKFLPDSKDSPILLETKDASTVIKSLNYEFKMLYGAVQPPKGNSAVKKNLESNNNIIQIQTVFPIFDPKEDSNTFTSTEPDVNNNINKENCWQTLLKFPLLNQQSLALSSNLEISEINSLRKTLEEKSQSYVPSVSKILEKTMPQERAESLRLWKENMIKELGEEEFQKYQEEILSNGEVLHSSISNYLANVPRSEIEIEKAIEGHWKSLKPIFPSVSDVKLLEERVTHPFLRYKGIVDCFARYKGSLVVIEWKTSKKRKLSLSSTFDNPLQIAAYVGALNFDPKYQYLVNKGLIVVSYPNGSNASAHFMDENVMLRYWKEWLARIKLYWELTEKEEGQS